MTSNIYDFKEYSDLSLLTRLHKKYIWPTICLDKNNNIIKEAGCRHDLSHDINTNDISISDNVYNIEECCIMGTLWHSSWAQNIDIWSLLYDFYNRNFGNVKYSNKKYKFIVNFKEDQSNQKEILHTLFKENDYLNIYPMLTSDPKYKIIKFNGPIIIVRYNPSNNFLSYPIVALNKINLYFDNKADKYMNTKNKNVFLDKAWGSSPHRYPPSNLDEIIKHATEEKFVFINPELVSNLEMYNVLKTAENIITFPGSCLASLIFANKMANIFCINSETYQPEWRRLCKNIEDIEKVKDKGDFEKKIWKKFIDRYENFYYLDTFLNKITDEQTNFILSKLKK